MLLLIVAWFHNPLFRSKLTSFTFWSIIWPSGRIYFFLKHRLKQPPPQDYMAHHRGTYDKYSAGLSDKYNDKYSEGLAAKYNDKYAPRSSSSLMPASTDSMVGFMAKYKWVEIRNCKRNTDELKSKSIYYSLAKRMGHTCWNIDLSRKFFCSWVFLTYFKQGCWCDANRCASGFVSDYSQDGWVCDINNFDCFAKKGGGGGDIPRVGVISTGTAGFARMEGSSEVASSVLNNFHPLVVTLSLPCNVFYHRITQRGQQGRDADVDDRDNEDWRWSLNKKNSPQAYG